MNTIDILIIVIVANIFIFALFKVYKNAKMTKAGLGCAGCRIADSCKKSQNINRLKNI